MSSNDWRLVVSHAAQEDLQTFGWDPDVESAGVVFGRYETSGIRRVDDGRSVFVRRIVRAEYNCTSDSGMVDYDAVFSKQTIPTRGGLGGGPGLTGAADYGLILGNCHSHPNSEVAELSDQDIRAAKWNSDNAPPALQGKPSVVMLAIGREEWREGYPELTWADPLYTWFLITSHGAVIRPHVSLQSRVEWLVEEGQRELAAVD